MYKTPHHNGPAWPGPAHACEQRAPLLSSELWKSGTLSRTGSPQGGEGRCEPAPPPAMQAPAPAAARGAGRPRGHGVFPGRRSRRSCGRRRRTIATRPTSPRPAATRFDTSSVLDDSPVLLNTALSCAIDSDLRCFGL